jgi:hypothetical protein
MQNNVHEELDRVQNWSQSELLELLNGLAARLHRPPYEEVLVQAQLLSSEDRARLLKELVVDLSEHIENLYHHSITELRGVGKDFWRDIDVEKYIEEERNSWDG